MNTIPILFCAAGAVALVIILTRRDSATNQEACNPLEKPMWRYFTFGDSLYRENVDTSTVESFCEGDTQWRKDPFVALAQNERITAAAARELFPEAFPKHKRS